MAGLSRRLWLCIAAMLAMGFTTAASAAPSVTPSPRVTAAVVVRAEPTARSDALARLRPGEILPFAGEGPGWYQVTLPDGRSGWVSKGWTDLVPETVVAAAPLWRVHFVDVGTGLATFVEGPDFTLVYDGGSNDDYATGADNRFLAYIRRVRPDLQVIDHLILSHPHQDHVALLPDLFGPYQVRNVWDSGRIHDICDYRAFLSRIAAEPGVVYHDAHPAGAPHVVTLPAKPSCGTGAASFSVSIPHGNPIVRGLVVALGAGASMTFLHDGDATPYPNKANRNSVPVRLDLGASRLLFMGDAEAGERDDRHTDPPRSTSIEGQVLICCAADLRADLLVAGHHGSSTSSRTPFLDAVGAQIFVIASGPKDYGRPPHPVILPDAAIVHDLEARGALWRTDFDDPHCRTDTAKIGRDNDKPGGCDNILVRVPASGPMLVNYERIHD